MTQQTGPAALKDLNAIADELLAVLQQENQSLKRMDLKQLGDIVSRKVQLAGLFAAGMRQFAQNDNIPQADGGAGRARLISIARDVNAAAAENEIALRGARDANQALLDAVIETIDRQRSVTHGYGRRGQLSMASASKQPMTLFQDHRL